MSRVYEAFIILLLTGMLVIGIVWVADSMIRTSSSDNALVVGYSIYHIFSTLLTFKRHNIMHCNIGIVIITLHIIHSFSF